VRRRRRGQVAFLERVLRSAPDALLVLDRAGRVTLANPAADTMFGYPAGTLVTTPVEELIPRWSAVASTPASTHGTDADPGLVGRRRDGREFPLEIDLADFPGERETFTTVVIRDITARRNTENGWQRARDAALVGSRLKSQFVATMSHEIRTPITGVIGLTDLLLTTELDEVQRRYVDGVRVSGEALMALINDVLDFSKIEEGKVQLDEADFDLGMLLDEVVTITAHSAASKGLHLQVDRDPDLPLDLRGDPGRIRQILLNLVSNAVKFTDEGGVAIRARPGGASGAGGDRVLVRLEVADTGVGMDPDKLQELFEPFVQADPSTTRTHGGTGLGLTICRQLAEAMGGGVEAESRLGQGTTLRVLLPLRRARGDLGAGRASRTSAAARPRPGGRSARPGRILVVEDNEISQAVVVGALTAGGYAVDVAVDGVEALQRADGGEYQAILMDCHMPRMDGFTAAQELRRRSATAQTPILAMTADVLKEQRDRCLASGMDDFIPKPIRPHELRTVLAGWTGYRSAEQVTPAAPPAAPASLDPVRARLTEILGDRSPSEVELVTRIVTSFPAKAERLVQDLVAAVDREDDDAVLHAHSLKGAAATLGAIVLTAICEDLERAARSGRWQRITELLPRLREALRAFDLELASVRAEFPELAGGSLADRAR
jgi:PAS domain S-box-containing protein